MHEYVCGSVYIYMSVYLCGRCIYVLVRFCPDCPATQASQSICSWHRKHGQAVSVDSQEISPYLLLFSIFFYPTPLRDREVVCEICDGSDFFNLAVAVAAQLSGD